MDMYKDNRKKKMLAFQYTLLQGTFWTSFAVLWGFAAVYLQHKGFTNTQIGTITSSGTLISIILQPILASISEKRRNIKPQNVAAVVGIFITIGTLLLLFTSSKLIIVAIVYAFTGGLCISIPSLLNTIGLSYINQGIPINYGLSRGIGSITYAIMALFLGMVIEKTNPGIIIPIFLVLAVTMTLILISLKNKVTESDLYDWGTQIQGSDKKGFLFFIFKYKKFMGMIASVVCLFAGHNIINTYMVSIVKSVGGNNSHLGFSVGLAALVELPTMLIFYKLARKWSVGKLLKISALFFALKAFVISIAPNIQILLLSQLFQIGGFALFTPASVYYVNQVIDKEHHPTGQAVLGVATMGLGGAFGNILGGKLLDMGGVRFMLHSAVAISLAGLMIMLFSTEEKNNLFS